MHSVLTCVNEICFIGTGGIREKSGETALPVGSEGSADNKDPVFALFCFLIKPIPDFSRRFHIHFIIPRGRLNKKNNCAVLWPLSIFNAWGSYIEIAFFERCTVLLFPHLNIPFFR
jgi:hypothetical protein